MFSHTRYFLSHLWVGDSKDIWIVKCSHHLYRKALFRNKLGNKTEGNPEGKTKTTIHDFEITEYVTKQMPYVYLLKKMLEISFPDETNAGTLKVSNRQLVYNMHYCIP